MKLNLLDFATQLTADRRHNGELSPYCRAAICCAVACGQSEREVARLFRVSRHAVQRTLESWISHQSFESKPRKGRPEVLTRREKRYIVTLLKRNRSLAKKALVNAIGSRVSYSTIRRCLRAHHMRKWKAMKRIPLTKEVALDRYNFARDWLENTEELLQVCRLGCGLSSWLIRVSRLCSLMSVLARTTLQILLAGYSAFLLRSITSNLLT